MAVNKRSQIGVEIMYSVGILMIIFLLLTGISFTRNIDLIKTDDYIKKRNECLMWSDYVSSAFSNGHNTRIEAEAGYNVNIQDNGVIEVSGEGITNKTIEATCSFAANLSGAYSLGRGNRYEVLNQNGVIAINPK